MQDRRLAFSCPLRQEDKRQRGRHRQRDDERSQHREDVGDPERGEEAPGHPRQRDDRQEHQDHREGRIDDRAADFEGGFEDDNCGGSRVRAALVLAQTPGDVLDADNRVVDDLAERDRQAAQRHRV